VEEEEKKKEAADRWLGGFLQRVGVPELYRSYRTLKWESDTENRQAAETFVKSIAGGIAEGHKANGVVFHGPVGTGKTLLAIGIITQLWWNRLRKKISPPDFSALFVSAARLPDRLRVDAMKGRPFAQIPDWNYNGGGRIHYLFSELCTREVVVLDDFAVGLRTPYACETMYKIIDARKTGLRTTIITTNCTRSQIVDLMNAADHPVCELGNRFMSRLAGMCDFCEVDGEDRRLYE
jgi:DNA replication protein DnaC